MGKKIPVNKMDEWCSSVPPGLLDGLREIRKIGEGSFGTVTLVTNAAGQEFVIKEQMLFDSEDLSREAINEVDFLMRLGGCPQILPIQGICAKREGDDLKLQMFLPKMDGDLKWYIQNTSPEVPEENFEYFLGELTYALDALVQAELVHADVKPGNILVALEGKGLSNPRPKFYLADFGLTFNIKFAPQGTMLPMYTIWWRPPEYFLKGYKFTNMKLGVSDMWALGLTGVEYLTGKYPVTFYDPSKAFEWLRDRELIELDKKKIFKTATEEQFLNEMSTTRKYVFPTTNPFLREMLMYSPRVRITPRELLEKLGLSRVPLPMTVLEAGKTYLPREYWLEMGNDLDSFPPQERALIKSMVSDCYHRINGQTEKDFWYLLQIVGEYIYRKIDVPDDMSIRWKLGEYLARLQYVVLNPALEATHRFYNRGDRSLDSRMLRIAAQQGDLRTVEELLLDGVDVHAKNDQALDLAVDANVTDVVEVLVAAGATATSKIDLEKVIETGNSRIILAVIAAGADVRVNEDIAIRTASEKGLTEVVRALLAAGADVDSKDGFPLFLAVQNRHLDTVQVLLAAGADPNAIPTNPKGLKMNTPLIKAAVIGELEIVRALLAAGAVPDFTGAKPNDPTALAYAAQYDHPEIVRELLAVGADINAAGGYALSAAIHKENGTMVWYLLKQGADIHAGDDRPLKLARKADPAILKMLEASV